MPKRPFAFSTSKKSEKKCFIFHFVLKTLTYSGYIARGCGIVNSVPSAIFHKHYSDFPMKGKIKDKYENLNSAASTAASVTR